MKDIEQKIGMINFIWIFVKNLLKGAYFSIIAANSDSLKE